MQEASKRSVWVQFLLQDLRLLLTSGCLALNSYKGEEGILVTQGVFSLYLNVEKVWLHLWGFFSDETALC